MEEYSVDEIIRKRKESRLTDQQGIEFLREYREHPEKYLPLVDHQYKYFDEWEDQICRNMCWDAGIFQDNCPYFAECWKVFFSTFVTVFIPAEGITWEPNIKNILVEFIRNGLISGLSGEFLPRIRAVPFTDGAGNEFYSINLQLGEEEKGQYIFWGRGHFNYEQLNEFNGQE